MNGKNEDYCSCVARRVDVNPGRNTYCQALSHWKDHHSGTSDVLLMLDRSCWPENRRGIYYSQEDLEALEDCLITCLYDYYVDSDLL